MIFYDFTALATRVVLGCLLVGATLLTSGCGIAREKPVVEDDEKKQIDGTILVKLDPGSYFQTWQMDNGQMVSFSISIPEAYSDEMPSPLVLSLHFGAERITQFFGNQMVQGLVKPATLDLNPIIVAPDVINKSWVNFRCEECVMALLNEVFETYNVDRNRVLVIGYSLGAQGAWHYAGKYPDVFTAAIPVAGRPPEDFLTTDWSVPMLVVHSKADEIFPFDNVAGAVKSIEDSGNTAVQIYPLEGISHYESTKFIEPLKEAVDWVKQVWSADAEK